MVYVRLITPALAGLLDAAVSVPELEEVRLTFMEERLRALVHTQSPSQLEDALWIYLVCQRQLLSRAIHNSQAPDQQHGTNGDAPGAPTTTDTSGCPLPPPLHLPGSITCISDAVRWYCGELSIPTARPAANECQAASQPPPPQETEQAQKPKPTTAPHTMHTSCTSPAVQPGARIDALLRQRQQPIPSPAPSQPAQHPKQVTGPLATVQLALDAFSQFKRATTLRQPRTIALLVRDFVSLWSLIYLCKQLKRHQLRKERLLTSTATAAASPRDLKRGQSEDLRSLDSAHVNRSPHAHYTDAKPVAVCFHDYDLLLPWGLVQRVLSPSDVSMAAVAVRCRAMDESKAGMSSSSSATTAATGPTFVLILNPAVTAMDDNPDRLSKNARIDAIDKAASTYYYALLSARAHGQTSGHHCGARSGASIASAAAHQEALRSSLAAVDIGDYGVLDPSRMRVPPYVAGTDGLLSDGVGRGSSRAVSASLETTAKSYALFLRDVSIGFDIQVMTLTGAGVGYYLGYLRGLSSEWCTLYAVVGLVTMMLVDAVLLIIRVGRQDEAVLKARQRIRRQREKLEKDSEKLVQSMQAALSLPAADVTNSTSSFASKATTAKPIADAEEAAAASPQTQTDPHTKKNQ
ncbi:hypothetical protein, conserved [Leishmania lindenbergi]|uniref:Uncharacterized protein n=1 Tax=Leishmania lindenbergi TaxID=651832 RepID=A0AAW3AT07_9TRYP